jgi:hypothetical protein
MKDKLQRSLEIVLAGAGGDGTKDVGSAAEANTPPGMVLAFDREVTKRRPLQTLGPEAYLITCRRPGKTVSFASLEPDGVECWPKDQWATIECTCLDADEVGPSVIYRNPGKPIDYTDRRTPRSDGSELYFESHVTIEPVFDARLEQAKILAAEYKFRVADLLMKKREADTEERSAKDTFMTGHGQSLHDIENRTMRLVNELKDHGFKVWRYKIEDTVLDSRTKDVWNLLG